MSRTVALLFLLVAAIVCANAYPQQSEPSMDCGPNEEFNACGTECFGTCENPKPQGICTLRCLIGCQCKEGYVRNAQKQCVLTKDC